MVEVLPLTLVGDNLGERHRFLNTLVSNIYQQNVSLHSILELPEVNAIDRVFKIELASKHKHFDFIVNNLKNKDMLYVSLALKNTWMLDPEYSHIINPVYLELHLYPEMITTAVNKMKNFIELKLKDSERCREFYKYYESDFNIAVKFLWHCSKEFISEEIPNLMDKISPKHLRILCEACPQVGKIYFEGLQNNQGALHNYLKNREKYYNSILNILKVDGDLFLDLTEKYFDRGCHKPLSSSATKYIMKNHKNRYLAKPELYAAWLLHVKTLARFLSSEQIKDIVLRLARAQYLNSTFTYKDAEPFIKCLSAGERALIKKQIFVDKCIGTMIETWPYPAPESLQQDCEYDTPFADIEHDPYEYEHIEKIYPYNIKCLKRSMMKKSGRYTEMADICYSSSCLPHKSSLGQLFERYRFANFDKTFVEFRKLLLTEGSIEGRRNMMLVLVSKTGGNETKLEQLLKFLVERHNNEPAHLRDAVARSMVKRAFVWRLGNETWDALLKWATTSVSEILHTTILRRLLAGSACSPVDLSAYLLDFSDLTEYSLNAVEKACIAERLPTLLISAEAPGKLLDIVKAYNLRVDAVPGAEDLLVNTARKDKDILQRLFESRISRKLLLKESFIITQTDAAYLNALKHNPSVLANGESFATHVSKEKSNHDRFLRALVLYFSEPDGLAVRHRIALEKNINEECQESFARPLAFLFNLGNKSFTDYIDKTKLNTLEGSQRKFAARLRANAFVVRPVIDIDVVEWQTIGTKFICNNVLVCSDRDVDANIDKCLNWKKTLRAAWYLTTRSKSATKVFSAIIRTRPIVALKFVLSDIRNGTVDILLWNQVKPIILNLDLSNKTLQYVKKSLGNLQQTSNIDADYWTTVYTAFRRASELEAMSMLCKIENLLTEVDRQSLEQIISEFLCDKLDKDVFETYDDTVLCLYFRIIAKYLLTSESENIQKVKRETVCDPFFDKIEILWHKLEDKSKIIECLDDFIFALKYSKAFLNTKYVSCIPMFGWVLDRLSKILPRERYFEKYACIHMTMLYYRSIRQILKQKPEALESRPLIQNKGVKLVGFTLGKYIGNEIKDLAQNYFKSIIDIYQRALVRFFSEYFEYNISRANMVMSVIRGLIEGGVESQLLAQHVFQKEHSGYVNVQEREEILKLLKDVNTEEVKFFLYASIYPY